MSESVSEGAAPGWRDRSANPAPLGLCAFGMTTILLNIHNAGFFALGGVILAMGVFYGGMAQIIVGLMEWKKGNSFGTLAFFSYGAFWLSFVLLVLFPNLGLGTAADSTSMASYLLLWGLFTLVLFPIALRSSKALGFVFGSLALLFFILAVGKAYGSTDIMTVAGYWGIIVGASAIYSGIAQIYNEAFGRVVLPLCAKNEKWQLRENVDRRSEMESGK
jgi:succinate-acetate transporter protein